MSIHPERTFERLRYPLGGDRPSQTTRLALSTARLTGRRERQHQRRVVFHLAPPPCPQARVLRLPPRLRIGSLVSGPRCSKAPRGLFVLSWVTRIFTGTAISPSPLSRQCSSRYSLRAGRNLPDKEFRYLRTVIVTAAVHRGFALPLRSRERFTFRHWAGVSPYISTCVFAETCVFGKQSLEPMSCDLLTLVDSRPPELLRFPFFQRYGVILPSSLTEGRSCTWGDFPLPTSVGLRYGHNSVWLAAFLGGMGSGDFRPPTRTRANGHGSRCRDLPRQPTSGWQPILSIRWVLHPYRVPASLHSDGLWCRTIRPAFHRLRR
jgi:hypothetical protein